MALPGLSRNAAGSIAERTSVLYEQILLNHVRRLDQLRLCGDRYARKGTNHLHTAIMQLCEHKTEVAEKLVSVREEESHYMRNPKLDFSIRVISDAFKGKSSIQRHRMINTALSEEFANGLHALSLEAKTGEEAARTSH